MIYIPPPYQAYCIQREIDDPYLALWLDMGLGKTVITLTAVNDLKYNRFAVRRCLVIAPKKVAEATWSNEAAKWDHLKHLRVQTALGSEKQRIRALCTPADVYVINRENVEWLVDYYSNAWPFDMVVLDESSSFKNHKAKRFVALKRVRSRISRLVELTGTPAPNGLLDLWAQVFLLDGGQRLGKTIGAYRERYFKPDKRSSQQIFSWKAKEDADAAVRELLGDICVSMKSEDYLQLPEIVYSEIPVVLDPKAAADYARLEKVMLLEVPGGVIDAGTAAALTNKLLQLCNGAIYDADSVVHELHACKLDAFMETVEQLGEQRAMVFYNFQHDRDRLLARLEVDNEKRRKAKLSPRRVKVYTNADDERAWNAGEIDILLAQPASCAYGLNLQQGGHHVIWFGLNWSLELYLQANKRLYRQGQEFPVIVHHLVTQGGVDEDVMATLGRKGATQGNLLDALKARIAKAKGESA